MSGIVPALLLVLSLLLCITPGSSHFVNPEDGKVLVLGSGGLIGSHVVKWLKTNDYEVAEVRNRAHVDLRQEDALDAFQAETISFVFFLACEVGGSKYIDNDISSVQLAIVESNVQMYQVVFGWLKKHQIPFAFSSSYMHFAPTSYGAIKRLGEAWIRSMGHGRITRLWNVYGVEKLGLKSHVMTDWVNSCLYEGKISCRTDGEEERQFLHVEDCARAFGAVMQHYDSLGEVIDVTSGEWTKLKDLARLVGQVGPSEGVCPVSFTEKKSSARERLEPAALLAPQYWRPVVSLADGIQQFYAQVAVSGGSKQGQEEEDREKEEAREEEEGLDTGVSQGDDDQRGMKDEL